MSDTDGVRSPQSLTDEAESAIRCVDDSPRNNDDVDCNLQAAVIEVQCGKLSGQMHMDKFVCPGIHQNCIEIEGHLISPKDYTIRANKDKQKDWKGSIRIGKSNLRALMEMKALDFYQHESYCSGKCQSRNYMTSNKADGVDFAMMDMPMKSPATTSSHVSAGTPVSLKTEPACSSSGSVFINDMFKSNANVASYSLYQPNLAVMKEKMIAQPEEFWANMHQLGILNELVDDISHAVEKLKLLYTSRPERRQDVADQLSALANTLDLGEQIGDRVHSKRVQTAIESNVLSTELQELQRKAEERRRKQEEAKRKADMLDRLFSATSSSPPIKFSRPST